MKSVVIIEASVRYSIAPDPVRAGMIRALPRRAVDKIIAGRLGLLPPA